MHRLLRIQSDIIGMPACAKPRAQETHQAAQQSHQQENNERGNDTAADIKRIAADAGIDLARVARKLPDCESDDLRDCACHEALEEAHLAIYCDFACDEASDKVDYQANERCQAEQANDGGCGTERQFIGVFDRRCLLIKRRICKRENDVHNGSENASTQTDCQRFANAAGREMGAYWLVALMDRASGQLRFFAQRIGVGIIVKWAVFASLWLAQRVLLIRISHSRFPLMIGLDIAKHR